MKVLLINDSHTVSGGAETYFFDLKERLKKTPNIEVYSFGFSQNELIGKDFVVFKSIKSNFSKLLWRTLFHPIIYYKLRKQLKRIRPDIIHIHNIKQYPISLLWALKPYPVVQTMHDYSSICPIGQNIHKNNEPCSTGLRVECFWQHQIKYNPLTYLGLIPSFYLVRRILRKTVKIFIAPSPLLVDFLQKNYFKNVSYIPPFKTDRRSYSFENVNPRQFLFAGNLGTHKGVQLLLEEFALACQKNQDLILNIAGSGPEEARMREGAKRLGIEKNVIFLGWQKDLYHFFQTSIAVFFTSIGMESFGLVMTEAMSHARPLIGINRGTAQWLIDDNHTGLLFDPLKKGDLANKILCIAENPEFAKMLGMNGFKKLQTLIQNDLVLEKIIDVYKNCLRV